MKQILTTIGLVLLLPVFLSAQNPSAISEDPVHQELRDLRDGLLAAMNRGTSKVH
jgi:hypothetical protein